jgi:hypothetical protein
MPLVQPALAARVGQMLVQAENFRKKFRSRPIAHLRVPLKHAAPLPSSHFGVIVGIQEEIPAAEIA